MLNLVFDLVSSPAADKRDAEEGFLGKLVLWTQQRVRYSRGLHELRRLSDRDLDDINIVRIDLPELA